ncbi:hypothetical protein FQR65_LT11807 [Abscondita terminalis]|nr:hypothetical protein FQR65_LT11807 [Abscondita terminalis]
MSYNWAVACSPDQFIESHLHLVNSVEDEIESSRAQNQTQNSSSKIENVVAQCNESSSIKAETDKISLLNIRPFPKYARPTNKGSRKMTASVSTSTPVKRQLEERLENERQKDEVKSLEKLKCKKNEKRCKSKATDENIALQ